MSATGPFNNMRSLKSVNQHYDEAKQKHTDINTITKNKDQNLPIDSSTVYFWTFDSAVDWGQLANIREHS